jgi:hypothetical protein
VHLQHLHGRLGLKGDLYMGLGVYHTRLLPCSHNFHSAVGGAVSIVTSTRSKNTCLLVLCYRCDIMQCVAVRTDLLDLVPCMIELTRR